MDLWDDYLLEEEDANKLRHTLEAQGFVLFFKKGSEYFGASEDSRVVFARMKNPDDEMPDGWEDEASFSAINLNKLVKGEPAQHVFGKTDLKKIKIVDRDDVVEALKGEIDEDHPMKHGEPKFGAIRVIKITRFQHHDRDEAPNFHRADEE